jgi:hypothetical protein
LEALRSSRVGANHNPAHQSETQRYDPAGFASAGLPWAGFASGRPRYHHPFGSSLATLRIALISKSLLADGDRHSIASTLIYFITAD